MGFHRIARHGLRCRAGRSGTAVFCELSSQSSSSAPQKRVAIVGSGPSGCYTAKYLRAAWEKQTNAYQIDVLERLPTPFGLVRHGVAPDHPEVKNVQHDFETLFDDKTDNDDTKKGTIRYFGNVHVGRDVSLDELRQRYQAVVLATGCESDRADTLPGLPMTASNILSARQFVAWYNGHPEFAHVGTLVRQALGVTSDNNKDDDAVRPVSVVVVGHGNVALDCARVLAKGGTGLHDTDLAADARAVLGQGVANVTLVGRRGHVQGAFTIKEVRELCNLQAEGFGADFAVQQDELDLCLNSAASQDELSQSRPKQRIDKLLRKAAAVEPAGSDKRVQLRFLQNPVLWELDEDSNQLTAVVCERTQLEGDAGAQRAVGTGEMTRFPCQLALLSIGYKGVSLPGMQDDWFDADVGVVRHERGRIVAADGNGWGGLYAAGWFKRGPSGIIGTNIPDAKETVATVVQDLETAHANENDDSNNDLGLLLRERDVQVVDWEGYKRIEAKELIQRRSDAQPREKITSLDEQIDTALER